MQHALARQMIRQRLAAKRLAIPALRALATLGILHPCRTFAVLRHPLFKLPKDEFQLLDLAVELLGRAAEPRPSQHRKLRLEMFDLKCLGIELGIADRNHAITFDQKGFLLGEQRFLLGQGPLERSYIVGGIGSSAYHRNYANQSANRTLMNPC